MAKATGERLIGQQRLDARKAAMILTDLLRWNNAPEGGGFFTPEQAQQAAAVRAVCFELATGSSPAPVQPSPVRPK